jgi:heptosyltransferase II
MHAPELEAPRRILVRLPNWVGDVLMATPALRALRDRYPAAEIVAEGRRGLAELLLGLRSVDRFVADPGKPGVRGVLERRGSLQRLGCDWAVLLPDSVRSALAPALARIPVRIGYARDPARRLLLTRALEPPPGGAPISMVERYLAIVRALGCADPEPGLEIAVSEGARQRVRARLRALGIREGAALCVVTPGASFGSSKLWPPEHFAHACDDLAARFGLRVVLAPGPGEEALAAEVVRSAKTAVASLAEPPTSLGELAALIEQARLLLTNDTGPRHMAVALRIPVVVLMGPTDPRHTLHLLERQRVLREPVPCSPCHLKVCPIDHRCMTRLAPERVVEAAAELLP